MVDFITPALGVLGNVLGASSARKAANEAKDLQQQALNNQTDWLNRQWQYAEPYAQTGLDINAGLAPTRNAQMGALAYLYNPQLAGSQIALPEQENTAIPVYLRQYANAPEGSWQNELYRYALYNKTPEGNLQDILKDIGRGENPMNRIHRSRMTAPPADYTPPPLTLGGESIQVPGGTATEGGTGTALPSWMQVPDVDEIISTLRGGSEVDMARLQQQLTASNQAALRNRGYVQPGMSSTQVASEANVPLWMNQERTRNEVGLANTKYNMGMTNNTYLQNLATNMQNQLAGYQGQMIPMGNTSAQTNAAANSAANYGNMANQYNQQAGNAYGSIGSILGDWWANQQAKTQSQAVKAASNSASYSPNLQIGGGNPNNGLQVGGNIPDNYFQRLFGY